MARQRRSNGGAIALVAIVVLVIFASGGGKTKGKGKKISMTRPAGGVNPVNTSPGTSADWARARFADALEAVHDAWGADTIDEAKAADIALSILTHWSIETGSGAGEWNNNPGNINATGDPFVWIHDVDGTWHKQRTFDTIHDGAAAYVNLLRQPRYAGAAKQLADNPTSSDWFISLGHEGWFDPTKANSTWEAARAMYESRRKLLEQYAEAS